MTKAVNELGLECSPPWGAISQQAGRVVSPGRHQALPHRSSPFFSESPWRAHKIGWTSNFAATLYGCALGLPGHDAHQWGSRSGCSFTQGPEESDRPGSTCHQSHRPSHRVFDIQPDSVGVSRWRRWKRRTKASRPPRACPKNNGRS